ncbi:MAG: hypothetical protein M0027_16070 [Candidatus Dormibacteraeota bacterium]|nr:hypothetical protein [Candidatus Dormibacteraeota bacterium]
MEFRIATAFHGLGDGDGQQLRPGERLDVILSRAALLEITLNQRELTGVYARPSF